MDNTNEELVPEAEVETKPKIKKVKEKDEEEKVEKPKNQSQMDTILVDSTNPPSIGETVEGPVIGIEKSSVYIDLFPYGTGIIYGREFMNARDVIKKVNIGDMVAAKVVDRDAKHGYIELSLKEARQAAIWNEAEIAMNEKRTFDLPVKEANKGGLMIDWQGLTGFLPASQLKSEHYPRVEDGDKDKILDGLRKLVGKKISVAIIGVVPKENKLIFSEKSPELKAKEKIIERYTIGDVVTGKVTGIVDFGLFLKIEDGLEGLVHISEIDWALVEDPKAHFKVGDSVTAKIIEIKEGKISLSVKALKENPWKGAEGRYKKGDVVEGVIIKYNKHGALASVEEGIAGLIHISEFGNDEKLRLALELGKTYKFKITLFDQKEQKMALSFNTKSE